MISKFATAGSTAPDLPAIGLIDRSPVLSLLRWITSLKLARFLMVGMLGLSTDAGLFSILAHGGHAEFLARAISLACATFVTWRLNRLFTFGPSGRHSGIESMRYASIALGAQLFSYVVFLTLRAVMPDVPALAALFTGAVLATSVSFLGQRFFTFAKI
ncbi:hypothetical protein BH10PSE7_BH10PSE7_34590 [soil metagenome]